MRNVLNALGLVLLCLFSAPCVLAQQSAQDCAELEDDQDRLACFDRFFARDRDAAEAPAAAAGGDRRRSAPSSSAPRASAPRTRRAPAASTESAPEPTPEQQFGREPEPLSLGGDSMTSVAVGNFDLWQRGQRVRLDNGQVWRVTSYREMYYRASNPEVRIEQGLLGAYYMHFEDSSNSLKVERIQ